MILIRVILLSVGIITYTILNYSFVLTCPSASYDTVCSKHGLVASGKNTLYLAGGEFPDGSASRSVWRYDPALDLWLEMCSMLIPRSELG